MKFRRLGNELWDLFIIPPGLQLFTLRDEAKKDFFGTLKKVAEMGYVLVEFSQDYGGVDAYEMKRMLNQLGLKTVSTYVNYKDMETDLLHQIQYASTLGMKYIVTSFPKERFEDKEKIPELISSLKKMAAEAKRQGMLLLYHPHQHEYEKLGEELIIDQLLQGVGSSMMQLELDLYFVKKAGLDPKATLQKYKGMSPLIHIKDMDKEGDFTEIGSGTIDWPPIFRILKETGVNYYFVEQNVSQNPLQSAKISLNYLKSIGVVEN
ncbi:sugar phosphate isomerase/epimerase family protein [Paenibacillus montanisoli]|uniref:Sugar phosphate isomerase/epimerase n=1 Tax=Paenibacillus montanisoli TaxID=2081970 RepID=A0A328U3A1_9BACL|nr:sugar phosphate isomerase/epimerase [Paenibacillus montanisoli]RAP77288.1 sugar phosphate isomerase/epimerase [Paenibacillus montanisoli]